MTTPLTHVGQTAYPESSPQQQQLAGREHQLQAQTDVQKTLTGEGAEDAASDPNYASTNNQNDE